MSCGPERITAQRLKLHNVTHLPVWNQRFELNLLSAELSKSIKMIKCSYRFVWFLLFKLLVISDV